MGVVTSVFDLDPARAIILCCYGGIALMVAWALTWPAQYAAERWLFPGDRPRRH